MIYFYIDVFFKETWSDCRRNIEFTTTIKNISCRDIYIH